MQENLMPKPQLKYLVPVLYCWLHQCNWSNHFK